MTKVQVDSNGKVILLGGKALVASNGSSGSGGSGEFLVQVIDYDGTVLKQEHLDTGATFTLPNSQTHEGLVFEGWSSSVTITNNTVTVTNSDITIGATYTTASGLSEFDITLTEATGLSVTLNMDGTKDWGDGTSDTSTTHTYVSTGDYTITCNGSTMNTSYNGGLFGQTNSNINYYVKDVRFGNNVTSIGNNAFYKCYSLTNIAIPSSVTSIDDDAFDNCCSLTNIAIPSSVTKIDSQVFNGCYSIFEYDFSKHTTIPTLYNTDVFNGINKICKIYVPWDLYESWKSATNWSTYTDYLTNKNPATLNFTISPSGNSIVYVNSKQIQGTSTSWVGSSTSYIVYDSTNNVVLPGTQTGITEGAIINITADLTTSSKITLSTGVTGLTVRFTVGGVAFNAADEGSGNYSINVVGSEITVDYLIEGGSDYVDVRGSITVTGSDITEAVTLTLATEVSFVRPNLTANGTIGGDSFAVTSTNTSRNDPAYLAFDSNSNSYMWVTGDDTELTIYSPDSLKVSTIVIKYPSSSTSYQADVIKVQGSKDNSTWVDLVETKYVSGITRTIDVNSNMFYSYYRLIMTCKSIYIRISDIAITATYKAPAA